MFIVSKEIFSDKNLITGAENICLFHHWEAAQNYMSKLLDELLDSKRKLDVTKTGAGFIVSFKDGLERKMHYKCEFINCLDEA